MKTILILISTALSLITAVNAQQTPFSSNVETMWLNGNKSGVLAIANQRLQNDPNDIAGLLLTLQYQFSFFDLTNFTVSANKVIMVGGTIKTLNFSNVYPSLKSGLQYIEQNIPSYTLQQIQTEVKKGSINGKPMDFLYALQAAELDGLIK